MRGTLKWNIPRFLKVYNQLSKFRLNIYQLSLFCWLQSINLENLLNMGNLIDYLTTYCTKSGR